MKCNYLLSGDFVELAKEEVLSLFDIKSSRSIGNLMTVDLNDDEKEIKTASKRLALTKNIYKLLFECKVNDLVEFMKKYEWDSVYKDNFCLRINYFDNKNKNPIIDNSITKKSINQKSNIKNYNYENLLKNKTNKQIKNQFSEKELAGYIWRSVSSPQVNLGNPKTKIELFFIKNKVYCGLSIFENEEDFESRKAHLRPFPHPSSLHPKWARALVNIAGIKENQILLDPFCGTGGFLIEAGLMNIKTVGYDISKNMVKGCKENLKYFNIKNFKIINKNALGIEDKFDCVATDLPYGLNSNVYLQYNKKSINEKSNKINLKTTKKTDKKISIKNLEGFYLKFLIKLRKKLKKKAVVIFPHYVNYKKLLKTAKFKIEKEFEIYVHRSLRRKIVKVK